MSSKNTGSAAPGRTGKPIDLGKLGDVFTRSLHASTKTRQYTAPAVEEGEDIDSKCKMIGIPDLMHQWMLGRPGYALGRIQLIIGKEGAGKTSRILSMVNLAYACGGVGSMIETERALSGEQVRAYIPNDDVRATFFSKFLKQPDSFEDSMRLVMKALESFKKFDPNGVYPKVLAYDTIAAVGTEREQSTEREVGDNKVGDKASLMRDLVKKILPILEETNTLMVFGNQGKEAIDTNSMPGAKVAEINRVDGPGGKAVGFHATYWEYVRKAGKLAGMEGMAVEVKMRKNKLRYPGRSMNYHIKFGRSARQDIYVPIDYVDETLSFLEGYSEIGLSRKTKNEWKCPMIVGGKEYLSAAEMYLAMHEYKSMETLWPILDIDNPYPHNVFWPDGALMVPSPKADAPPDAPKGAGDEEGGAE